MGVEGIKLHLKGVIEHKGWVMFYMGRFALEVLWRAIIHDLSKFTVEESEGFAHGASRLSQVKYNTPEYYGALRELGPALEAHYKANRHHPEHYGDKGLAGMSLLDVVEMFFDWMASTRRVKDGDIEKSVMANKERFHTETALTWVFLNEGNRQKNAIQVAKEDSARGLEYKEAPEEAGKG